MKNRTQYNHSNFDQAFFAQTILGLDLYPYQIEVLRSTQEKLNPNDMTDVIGMLPTKAGLTTITAIAAAHNIIFNSNNMKAFVSGTPDSVKELHDKVKEFLTKAEEYFDTKFDLVIDEPTKTQNKKGATNLYFTPSLNTFSDLPLTDIFVDSAITRSFDNKWFDDSLESLKPQQGRVFALSSGFNPMIQIIRNTLKRTLKRQVREIRADPTTIFGRDGVEQKRKQLGNDNFVNEVICGDVADPNTIARYYRGEL